MVMEINGQREQIKMKDEVLAKSRGMWESAHADVARLATICEVPAVALMNSGLYEARITKSEVF